jgi:hypothetical protein
VAQDAKNALYGAIAIVGADIPVIASTAAATPTGTDPAAPAPTSAASVTAAAIGTVAAASLMDALLTLLGLACKLLGFAEWVEGLVKRHQTAKQSQAVANSPISREELDERLQNHEF